jgi:hypothetical protein
VFVEVEFNHHIFLDTDKRMDIIAGIELNIFFFRPDEDSGRESPFGHATALRN